MSKVKLKTSKSIVKRFWKTGRGKIRHIGPGQDHFNARTSGNVTRRKRRAKTLHKTNKLIKKRIPYL